ncbi:unnamed protein product [Rotaria magnacalcarata]|nr:unnamed protein product [Rotaria magnacalcarata]CAF4148108.1 unnamed protein product [Rotaria magnacalcarata]
MAWAANGAFSSTTSTSRESCQCPRDKHSERPAHSQQTIFMGPDGRQFVVSENGRQIDHNADQGVGHETFYRDAYKEPEFNEVASSGRDTRFEKIVSRDQGQVSYPWRYTSSSNAKSLHSIEDAERYIIALAEIWKIRSSSPKGDDFLHDLVQAIKDGKPEYKAEYSLTNQRGETNYVMIVIRAVGGQQREVLYSFQQMTDPSMSTGHAGSQLPERKSIKWFQKKAAESLRIHTNVIRSFNTSLYNEDHPQLSDTQNSTNRPPG